jgi:hypothetical protein
MYLHCYKRLFLLPVGKSHCKGFKARCQYRNIFPATHRVSFTISMAEKSSCPWNETFYSTFPHAGKGISHGQGNNKQQQRYHNARSPATVGPTTTETPATAWVPATAWNRPRARTQVTVGKQQQQKHLQQHGCQYL